MHQLWRHKNGVWYVLHGPRLKKRISAKTKDRREAEKFLARFIAVGGESLTDSPTVGEILEGYKADRANVRAPNSLKYGVRGLQPLKDLFPSQLTPTVIRKWAKERQAPPEPGRRRQASAGTVLREVGILRAAMAWAVEHQWVSSKPIISNPVPTPRPRQRWLTKPEAETLIAACREPHMRVFIMLGLHTLARTGAILEARWSQVRWDRRLLDYGHGHGNKRRVIVPINDELLPVLQAANELACSDYIVEFRGKPLKTVKTGFEAACRRAGLEDVTPHVLRHTGASWLVEAGLPDDEVAKMLGDTPEMVRKVYGHFSPDYLRRAAAALQLRPTPPESALQEKGNRRGEGEQNGT